MTFYECLMECAGTTELVTEFDRLNGTALSDVGNGLNAMVDEATGRLEHDIKLFIIFVWDCVWIRCEPNPTPRDDQGGG